MSALKRIGILALTVALLFSLQIVSAKAASTKNTYKNTGNHRADIVGVALTQIGYTEGENNDNKYGSWYRLNHEPWCAIFVSWCARQADIPLSVLRNASLAVPSRELTFRDNHFGIPYYDGIGYIPLPGDLFFTKTFNHVGIVCYVDGEYFYTVEGNSDIYGNNNGGRVVCNRRKISDYYFGVPPYDTSVPAPEGVAINTDRDNYRQGENRQGDTIGLSWTPLENTVSQSLQIYYNGDLLAEKKADASVSSYTIENALSGGYLVTLFTKTADGATVRSFLPVTVDEPYTLTIQYHTGGGSISPVEKYLVTTNLLSVRAQASSRSTRLRLAPVNTVLTVTESVDNNGYPWGKTSYENATGWISLKDNLVTRTGYYANESGQLFTYPDGAPALTQWEYAQGKPSDLPDAQDIGLSRAGYTFLGWSVMPDGSGTIFTRDEEVLTTVQVCPDFRYRDMIVDLYAVWERNASELLLSGNPEEADIPAAEHAHTFSAQWEYDETAHFHLCSQCQEPSDAQPHIPGQEATEFTAQTCSQCGYVLQEALGHDFAAFWSWDSEYHFHACNCGEQSGSAPHIWDAGVETDGVMVYTCTVCGGTRAQLPPADWRAALLLAVPFLLGIAIGIAAAVFFKTRRRRA